MKRTVCLWIDIVCARSKPRYYLVRARTGAYVQMEVTVVLAVTRTEGRKKVGTLYFYSS